MKDKKQIIQDVLVVLVIIIIICFVVYYPQRNVYKNHRYTVATITDIKSTLNGDPEAIITYTLNSKVYNGSISSYKGGGVFYKKGDRVFVEYYPLNPDECNLVEGKYVSDKLINIPSDGWDKLPY